MSTPGLEFMGPEFLTWLWYAAEKGDGVVEVPDLAQVRVDLARRLVLESSGAIREGSTVRSDAPTQVQESRTALQGGKKVASATVLLDVDDRHFELTLNGETLTFSSVKLPEVLAADDEERLDERLALLDELEGIVDGLYARFARLRLDPEAWAAELEAIGRWVRAGVPPAEAG